MRLVGRKETWFTRARREWKDAAGMVGHSVWLCKKCGYWASYQSELPQEKCGNCGEQLSTDKDDPLGLPIVVETTAYGYRLVEIGKTPNAALTGERSESELKA